jgi:hypothetical protein
MFISKTDYHNLNKMALKSITQKAELDIQAEEIKMLNFKLLRAESLLNEDHNRKLLKIKNEELTKLTEEHRILSIENCALKESLRQRIDAMDLMTKVKGANND